MADEPKAEPAPEPEPSQAAPDEPGAPPIDAAGVAEGLVIAAAVGAVGVGVALALKSKTLGPMIRNGLAKLLKDEKP